MPAGSGYVSPYWNSGQFLGPGGIDYGTTPWGNQIIEDNPNVGYYRYGRQMGVPDDGSAFGRWFAQQYPQFNLGYGAYVASNPVDASLQGYTAQLGGYQDWLRRFNAQAPQLRGLDPSARGGGPARWIMR